MVLCATYRVGQVRAITLPSPRRGSRAGVTLPIEKIRRNSFPHADCGRRNTYRYLFRLSSLFETRPGLLSARVLAPQSQAGTPPSATDTDMQRAHLLLARTRAQLLAKTRPRPVRLTTETPTSNTCSTNPSTTALPPFQQHTCGSSCASRRSLPMPKRRCKKILIKSAGKNAPTRHASVPWPRIRPKHPGPRYSLDISARSRAETKYVSGSGRGVSYVKTPRNRDSSGSGGMFDHFDCTRYLVVS